MFDSSTDISSQPDALQMKFLAYPNPSLNKTTLAFMLKNGGDYLITLYDSKGSQIKIVEKGRAFAGLMNQIDLDCSHLPNGSYLIGLRTNSNNKTLKLLVNK